MVNNIKELFNLLQYAQAMADQLGEPLIAAQINHPLETVAQMLEAANESERALRIVR